MDKEKDALAYIQTMEEHERAIKNLADIGRYLATREDVTPKTVDAWHVLSDFIMGFSENE